MIVRAWEKRAETFNPVHPRDPALVSLFPFRDTASGVDVTDATALNYSAVFACVKVLAETLASVPLVLYQREKAGRRRATEHPLYRVLHDSPNPEMTAAELCETMMVGIGLRGNGLAEIVYRSDGQVEQLWPIRPDLTQLVRRDGRLWYIVRIEKTGEIRALPQQNVFHVRGLGSNGLWGYSPVDQARESIGLGLAMQENGARFFANDSTPSGLLKHPGTLSDGAQKRLKASVEEAHQGLENKHRLMVAEEGLDWQAMGVDPVTAQALEARQFQVKEIARWYRIPLHLIQDLDKSAFSNITEQSLEFVKYTMLPWFVKWAQAVSRDLLRPSDVERGIFAEHMLEALLRADPKTRGEFYKSLWMLGAINADEIREKENMNPISDGRGADYFVPLNTIPTGGEPAPPPTPDDRSRPPLERRQAQRAAEARRRIAIAFESTFADAARRVLRGERRDLMKLADLHLVDNAQGARSSEFLTRQASDFSIALEEFYQDPARREFLTRTMAPAFASIAPLLADEAQQSIATEPLEDEAALGEMVALLTGAFSSRHMASSFGQISDVLSKNPEAPKAALVARFDEWDLKRPAKIAKRETVAAAGLVTREVFRRGGIQRLQWVAFGDSCPFCEGINGKIVGIDQQFAQAGERVDGEGRDPLLVRNPVAHPPIHGGCDCGIVPA